MATSAPAQAGENPLVPNAALHHLYELMQALRAAARSRTAGFCPRGQEAIYAAGLHSLGPTDLVCAEIAKPRELGPESGGRWLETGDARATERLLLALGAAIALRLQGAGNLVLIFAAVDDLTPTQWEQVLGRAGGQSLPLILITTSKKRPGWLSSSAQKWGVPGIPVDAADALALYRVLQESLLRARHGDGPALLEPIAWTIGRPVDPLRSMQRLLESRGLLAPVSRAPGTSRRPAGSSGARSRNAGFRSK